MNSLFEKLKKIIEDNDKFIIMSHRKPDLDAIGSSFGIYEIINNDHGITIYDNNQVVDLNTILKTNNELHVNNKVYYIAILGDVNGDGRVNAQDVGKAYVTTATSNYTSLTKAEMYALDYNFDGKYNLLDVNQIYKLIQQ